MAPVRRSATPLPVSPAGEAPAAAPPILTVSARKVEAARLWALGLSVKEIAARLGVSAGTISTYASADRDAFPARDTSAVARASFARRRVEKGATLDAQIARAEALWAEGKSLREIAAALAISKGTVAGWTGKYRSRFPRRLGVDPVAGSSALSGATQPDPPPVNEAASAPAEEAAAIAIEPEAIEPEAIAEAAASKEPAPTAEAESESLIQAVDDRPARDDAFRPLPGFEPVALVDAASSTCRWPVHPAGRSRFSVAHHCCGRPTGDLKRSYCDTHARMSRGAGSSAERAAHKLPRLPSAGAVPVFFAAQAGA